MSPLRLILAIAFIDLIGFGIVIPLQASYADRLGASGLTFGLLVGVYATMQFIFNPVLGRLSDRIGRRRVLLLSVFGSAVSHSLLGIADLYASLPLLFVARTWDGITGANIATAQAYIADVTTPANRARGMGLFGAVFGLGFVVGPATGAALAAIGGRISGPEIGSAWPAFGASFFALTAMVLLYFFLPEPQRKTERAGRAAGISALRVLWTVPISARLRETLLLIFQVTFAFALLEVTFVYLSRRRFGVEEVGTGLLFAYIGVLMVVVQGGMVGKLAQRFGEVRLVSVAPFLTAFGFLLLAAVPLLAEIRWAWAVLIVACVPTALGHGLTGPSLTSLVSRLAITGYQGVAIGLAQGISSLARAVGPPVGGVLFDLGPSWPYAAGAALFICSGLFARRIRGVQEASIGALAAASEMASDAASRTPHVRS